MIAVLVAQRAPRRGSLAKTSVQPKASKPKKKRRASKKKKASATTAPAYGI